MSNKDNNKPQIVKTKTVSKTYKNRKKKPKGNYNNKTTYSTNSGHKLTPKEAKFIDNYLATGNARQSVIEAGYSTKAPGQYATILLNKIYIAEEIDYRIEQHKAASIAEADEIFQYLTAVMRGEIKDQFGLEAPIGERTKAAQELAKRKIDIPNRLKGNTTAEVRITLDWGEDE